MRRRRLCFATSSQAVRGTWWRNDGSPHQKDRRIRKKTLIDGWMDGSINWLIYSSIGLFISRLIDWLIDWSIGCFIRQLIDLSVCWLINWLIDGSANYPGTEHCSTIKSDKPQMARCFWLRLKTKTWNKNKKTKQNKTKKNKIPSSNRLRMDWGLVSELDLESTTHDKLTASSLKHLNWFNELSTSMMSSCLYVSKEPSCLFWRLQMRIPFIFIWHAHGSFLVYKQTDCKAIYMDKCDW